MSLHWRAYSRVFFAIVLVLSLASVLVHWHPEVRGQDCGLCHVQQMPGLKATTENPVGAPLSRPAVYSVPQTFSNYNTSVVVHSGRAPPASIFSL
jgi:hypothetical protein